MSWQEELRNGIRTAEQLAPILGWTAEETARRGWSPVFICESAGTQAEDAQEMKGMYQRCCQPLEKP